MKISWTPTARQTYFKVLDFLSEAWTRREVENFIYKTEHAIAQIAEHPYMFKASKKKKSVRKSFITEHNRGLTARCKSNSSNDNKQQTGKELQVKG
jgi:hypothetical protein